MEEIEFSGSNLENCIKNEHDTEKIKTWVDLTRGGLKANSNSKFWKEAVELAEHRFKKRGVE